MDVPTDSYTPHGYLDNPHHSRNLNPSGVLRSSSGIGFAWHYPALAKGYGFREIYRAGLNLAVTIGGRTRFSQLDFEGLEAELHTKNEFRYRWRLPELELRAGFHRVGEHTLACRLELVAAEALAVRVAAVGSYTRHLGAAGVWGESGLVGRLEEGALVLQGFEDGEAFALAGDRPAAAAGVTPRLDPEFLAAPTLTGDHEVVTGARGESVSLYGALAYDLVLEGGRPQRLELHLSRALRRDLALARLAADRRRSDEALAEHRADDRRFWRSAPRLEGDWPAHWRRGLVYDLETLRMMVREPLGIYRHRWDAMQIQAPRVVLAEAAIDALLLAYADPERARELLLGTFLDAPKANVPCSREDGSFNMVGANGSECGTAPEWGYPLRVAETLYDLDPDPAWLAALFPALARFLEWWLEERCDAEGYLVYDNSWESGQDLSARFGPQKEGGGSTIRMVRPVDLQAAMADACRVMTRFAGLLGRDDDACLWRARAERFRGLTAGLWHDGAFRDWDARVGWSDVWDVMQLAPLALGLATAEQVEALRPQVDKLADDAYLWPMFVWTAVDAAHAAGRPALAVEVASATIDRAYRMWDRRADDDAHPLPGVTCEYWGTDGSCGAEGYGWGAFGIHLLLRSLLGYRPCEGGFWLQPQLPPGWLEPGRRYRLRGLPHPGAALDIELRADADGASVRLRADGGAELRAAGAHGAELLLPLPLTAPVRVELRPAAETEG